MKQSGLIPGDRSKIWAWATLLFFLALTFAGWWLSLSERREFAKRRFNFQQREIVDGLQNRLTTYEQVLRGGLGMFAASTDGVTRAEWHSYVQTLALDHALPGVQGIGYAEALRPEDVPDFIDRVRAEGFPDFGIKPEGARDFYGVILYLEPMDARNRRAFGFDMWSEPIRRAAMQQARDTGNAVISSKVRLVQEFGRDVQAGFLMYLPYYGPKGVPGTVEGRRRLIEGFVYAPFRMGDFMAGLLRNPLETIRLRIFNGIESSTDTLLYDSRPGLPEIDSASNGLARTSVLEMYGQIWTIRLDALPSFWTSVEYDRPLWILLGGSLVSFLIFAILRGSAGRRQAEALSTQLGRIVEDSVSEIYVVDAESLTILYANRGARANLGYTREELSRMSAEAIYPDFSRKKFEKLVRPLRQDGSSRQVVWEGELRRRNGSTYPVEVRLQRASNTARPAYIGIIQDITERKRAEEQQRLLMDELNHRVKNTLATVQSLAAQTLRTSGSPDAFAAAMRGRLAALAGSHTLLTRTNWQGTTLADLVAQHLAPFSSPDRDNRIEGPDILLKPPAALAFGLALHELTTNAAKYGALFAPGGRVSVRWEVQDTAQGRRLALTWEESGGPAVQPPTRRGFGRTMIEQGLAYEIGGTVKLDFAPAGLRAVIDVPLKPETAEEIAAPGEAWDTAKRTRRRLAS